MKKLIFTIFLFALVTVAKAQTNVVFYTTEGDFMVHISDDVVPLTGGNFLDLVEAEFYDNVIFHRVIEGFIIQSGDPTGTGTGGPGYTIDDEFDPTMTNVQKTISMANSGPDSGGSQFFFNMVDNTYLDYDEAPLSSKHAVFGIVTENFNVVEDIAAVPVNVSDRPITDVIIDSIRVTDELLTGIEDLSTQAPEITVYPNPINDNSMIRINAETPASADIQLFDITGQYIAGITVEVLKGLNEFGLNTLMDYGQASGVYHIVVTSGHFNQTIQLNMP